MVTLMPRTTLLLVIVTALSAVEMSGRVPAGNSTVLLGWKKSPAPCKVWPATSEIALPYVPAAT